MPTPKPPQLEPQKCPHCFSLDTEIVASDQNKDAAVIRCRNCQRTSEVDVENPNVTLNDPRQGCAAP